MILRTKKAGYTILEVLIFVIVSSGLFVIAMTAIGGRQQQVQFAQAVRELDSKLKDVMNDVTTGYFPGRGEVRCIIIPGAPNSERPVLQAATSSQGTSDNCVFVGKALQFNPENSSAAQANSMLYIYTLVGRRTVDGGERDVSSIAQANPIAIAPVDAGSPLADYTEKIQLKWGLRVTRVVTPSSSPVDFGTIGFFNTFSAANSTNLVSESQAVDLAGITNTAFTGTAADTQYEAVQKINSITDDNADTSETVITKNPQEGVLICLENSSGNRKASILLSTSGRRLNTTMELENVNEGICV